MIWGHFSVIPDSTRLHLEAEGGRSCGAGGVSFFSGDECGAPSLPPARCPPSRTALCSDPGKLSRKAETLEPKCPSLNPTSTAFWARYLTCLSFLIHKTGTGELHTDGTVPEVKELSSPKASRAGLHAGAPALDTSSVGGARRHGLGF